MPEAPFTKDEMIALAANGVTRIDLLGRRGAHLVTENEVIAMALLLAASGAIPPIPDRKAPNNPNFTTQG